MSRTHRALFLGLASFLGAAGLLQVVGYLPYAIEGMKSGDLQHFGWEAVVAWMATALTAALASVLALVLAWRATDRAAVRPLALLFAFTSIFLGTIPWMFVDLWGDPPGVVPDFLPPLLALYPSTFGVAAWCAVASFLRFSVEFPRPLTLQDLARDRELPRRRDSFRVVNRVAQPALRLLRAAITKMLPDRFRALGEQPRSIPGGSVRAWFLKPLPVWGGAATMIVVGYSAEAYAMARHDLSLFTSLLDSVAWFLSPVVFFAALLLGIENLRTKYAASDAQERRALLWVVEGFVSGLWGLFAVAVVVAVGTSVEMFFDWSPGAAGAIILFLLVFLSPLVVVASLFIGVFFHGAVDPSLAIRKTSVYGSVGVLFLFLFAGFGNAAEGFLESTIGMPPFAGAVLTGGTIAVVLIPVKRRMDSFMNRILPVTVLADAPTRTATILFCDIVGYTRLTGEDQKTSLTLLTVFYKAASHVSRQHRGRLVNTVADEVVFEFKDARDAVAAARDLPIEFLERSGKLDLPTPQLCTGLHYGEVNAAPDGNLFGATMNIASRVRGVAEPGQVVLSAAVKEQLKEGEFEFVSLGAKELKNVADPVECIGLIQTSSAESFSARKRLHD
jgi:class 3 adenylate cyclase